MIDEQEQEVPVGPTQPPEPHAMVARTNIRIKVTTKEKLAQARVILLRHGLGTLPEPVRAVLESRPILMTDDLIDAGAEALTWMLANSAPAPKAAAASKPTKKKSR